MQGFKAPLITGLMQLARPEVYMTGLWIWNKSHHWIFHPSQFKLSILHGLVNGPPWADQKIRMLISKGYLENEEELFAVPKFQSLVLYLIQHQYFTVAEALQKSVKYSNFMLTKAILRKFTVQNGLPSVIYAHQNFLWNIIDNLLDSYTLSKDDLEFLLSDSAHDGLVSYLMTVKKIIPDFDTMQMAAKCGNMYVLKKITEYSQHFSPNYETLVLTAGSGNIHLAKYLIEHYKIEPERLALQSAANHRMVHYFVDTLGIPIYDGVFQAICERGILKSVKFFLEEKNIVPDFDICTISARSGNIELLQYLISKGFNLGASSLEEAARYGHLDLFKYLSVERPIEITNRMLILACRSGNVDILRYLVEELKYIPNSKSLDAVSESGSTEGFLYMINLPNISFSLTNLTSACIGGNAAILNYLIEISDLTPDIQCLNEALRRGHRDIFVYIHNFHKSIFLEATFETLIAAIEGKKLELIEYLLPQNKLGEKELGIISLLFNHAHPKSKEIINGVEDLFAESFDDDSSKSSRPDQVDPLLLKKIHDSLSEASLKFMDDYTHNQGIKGITRRFEWFKIFRTGGDPLLSKEISIDGSVSDDDSNSREELSSYYDVPIENHQILDNSIMTERDPLIIDDMIMIKVFENGTPEIVDYFIQIQNSWIQYQDLPYLMGNVPLVKYLIEVLKMEPISYHLKLVAASGNIELLKYLSVERNMTLLQDSLDFACLLGNIDPFIFTSSHNSLIVDNLILELACESGNTRLQQFLSSYKPKFLSYMEYLFRKREVNIFKKQYILKS